MAENQEATSKEMNHRDKAKFLKGENEKLRTMKQSFESSLEKVQSFLEEQSK